MRKIEYKKGEKFNGVEFIERTKKLKAKWLCICGKEFTASIYKVKTGHTKSCGCVRRSTTSKQMKKHGFSGTQIYQVWKHVKSRCYNVNDKYYSIYGGRGVKMQDSWIKDFSCFFSYVSGLLSYDESNLGIKGLTIDRIDTNSDYKEGNIQWSYPTMQARNRNKQKNNTSGYVGVSFIRKLDKFLAYIVVDKKRVNIGYHKDPKKAYELRKEYIVTNDLKGFKI
jgi:hypothetical protein